MLYLHQALRRFTTTWHCPGPRQDFEKLADALSREKLHVNQVRGTAKLSGGKAANCISHQAPVKCCVCLLCFSLLIAYVLSRTIAAWRASIRYEHQPHAPSEVYQRFSWFDVFWRMNFIDVLGSPTRNHQIFG